MRAIFCCIAFQVGAVRTGGLLAAEVGGPGCCSARKEGWGEVGSAAVCCGRGCLRWLLKSPAHALCHAAALRSSLQPAHLRIAHASTAHQSIAHASTATPKPGFGLPAGAVDARGGERLLHTGRPGNRLPPAQHALMVFTRRLGRRWVPAQHTRKASTRTTSEWGHGRGVACRVGVRGLAYQAACGDGARLGTCCLYFRPWPVLWTCLLVGD